MFPLFKQRKYLYFDSVTGMTIYLHVYNLRWYAWIGEMFMVYDEHKHRTNNYEIADFKCPSLRFNLSFSILI